MHDVWKPYGKILFGSQVTRLIARRVREHGVYCEIVPWHRAAGRLDPPPVAVIQSGGPDSTVSDAAPTVAPEIFRAGVPVLGSCYGQQAMVQALGGRVDAARDREFGRADLEVTAPSALFGGLWKPGERHPVWMSHGDRVDAVPPGFRGGGPDRRVAVCGHRRRSPPVLRGAVSSGGRAHAGRFPAAPPVCPGGGRPGGNLNGRPDPVGRGRAHPGAGGPGAGDLRAVGRRRQRRDGAAGARGRGRPADLRAGRPRPAACGRGVRTAGVCRFPSELSAAVAATIVNRVPGRNRVLYDVTSKPPGTIEWE